MSPNLIQRSAALCLAAVLTLALLASIDTLAQPEAQNPQWAQNVAPRA